MISQKNIDRQNISIADTAAAAGSEAGRLATQFINEAIAARGQANIILATGASQFSTLDTLVNANIDWSKVVMFHLDEYIGLPESSPASFRRYLKERFLDRVDPLKAAYLVNGESDPEAECERLGQLIAQHPIDVALVGIGENGHLAFNDPPADFDTTRPYIVVQLDEKCRKQQMGEGWFKTLEDVPRKAISMSIKQICDSRAIICTVPDERKAEAVRNSLQGPVTNSVPASILQEHSNCFFFLDKASAKLLDKASGF